MTTQPLSRRASMYSLIFLSGVAGLTYQVVWHRYLSILLGTQARATAIVLAIFLGGISLGYAMFGRWSRWKPWNLLQAYALVELGLGVWAILFPFMFHLALPLTPKLYALLGINNLLIDIVMSILLIGFPTFLMGGTLPLLTQGLSEDLDEASLTHAQIYGFNTLGACLGSLLAGYYLIPQLGLIRATSVGGGINIFVAAVMYFGFARGLAPQQVVPPKKSALNKRMTPSQALIMAVGFLSGFYLLTLETIFIRLIGLATGASNYNFCLIVSIFIFGLGAGALAARKIGTYRLSRLVWNQVWVSVLLFLVYLSGDYWSYYGHVIRVLLRDLPENFFVYQAMMGGALFLVLGAPIALAGLTVPLCFHLLKDTRESLGLRVGQLYSVNTMGCVLGALVGGYWLLNFFNLDQLFKLAVCLTCLSAAAACWLATREKQIGRGGMVSSAMVMAGVCAGVYFAPLYTKERFVQPFRHSNVTTATFKGATEWGKFLAHTTKLALWKDGPNTSMGVGVASTDGKETSRSLLVNGKSDGNTRGDYLTTVMLANLPALLSKNIARACVVGFGTGITIGTLSQYPEVSQIEVAEISSTIIENAGLFDAYNYGASKNPKVHFNEMDAFRLLYGTDNKFDLIVSEPSNPWVAGIENLYSSEFYHIVNEKLTEDGTFSQWLHTYSFTDDLYRMVLATMSKTFPYVATFQLTGGDLALIARKKPLTHEDLLAAERRFNAVNSATGIFSLAGTDRFESVLGLELVPSALTPYLASGVSEEHHLESPKLSNEAAKAFFVNTSAKVTTLRRQTKQYNWSLDSSLLAIYQGSGGPTWESLEGFRRAFCGGQPSHTEGLCVETMIMSRILNPAFQIDEKYHETVTGRDLASLNLLSSQPGKNFSAADLANFNSMYETYKKFSSPIAHVPASRFSDRLERCIKTVKPSDELKGECLLQKLMFVESLEGQGPAFTSAAKAYLDWFPLLDVKSPNHARLEEARDIVVKLLSAK